VCDFPLPDPSRETARIRHTERWPAKTLFTSREALDDSDAEFGLISDEDVAADEAIRLFGTTVQSEQPSWPVRRSTAASCH